MAVLCGERAEGQTSPECMSIISMSGRLGQDRLYCLCLHSDGFNVGFHSAYKLAGWLWEMEVHTVVCCWCYSQDTLLVRQGNRRWRRRWRRHNTPPQYAHFGTFQQQMTTKQELDVLSQPTGGKKSCLKTYLSNINKPCV